MDWSLILFVVVVLLCAWRGYRLGVLRSAARILSLIAGYAAAILLAARASAMVEAWTPLEGLVAFGVAALAVFVAASLGVSLLFALGGKLLASGERPSPASAWGGSAIGLVVGVILAVTAVWVYAFVRDLNGDGADTARTEASLVESMTQRVVGGATYSALNLVADDPEVAGVGAALMEAPAETALRARRLTESAEFEALLADPRNRVVLDSGRAELVGKLPAFRRLAQNEDLRALAGATGLGVDPDADPAGFEAVLAERVTDTWVRVRAVQNDPRVQAILNDPEFQASLQSGSTVDLLGNAQLLELANIIFADAGTDPAATPVTAADAAPSEPTEIHRWVDDKGRVHFGDSPPEQ